jgi:hypothetical protein
MELSTTELINSLNLINSLEFFIHEIALTAALVVAIFIDVIFKKHQLITG